MTRERTHSLTGPFLHTHTHARAQTYALTYSITNSLGAGSCPVNCCWPRQCSHISFQVPRNSLPYFMSLLWESCNSSSQIWSAGRLKCCWTSPAQSFFVSGLFEIHDQSFVLCYVFRNGASSSTKEGSVFLLRRYVCCTAVSAREYPRCHGVQVTVDSVRPLLLRNTMLHFC
jgi:hypothetical protein